MLWTNFLYGTSTFSLFPRHLSVIFLDSRKTEKNRERNLKFSSVSRAPMWPFRFWRCRTLQEHQHLVMTIISHSWVPKLYEICTEPPIHIYFCNKSTAENTGVHVSHLIPKYNTKTFKCVYFAHFWEIRPADALVLMHFWGMFFHNNFDLLYWIGVWIFLAPLKITITIPP
jgi:hypothetical protein